MDSVFVVQTSILVEVRPEVAFAFVADQTNAPRWQSGLAEVRRVSPGPLGVGSEHVFVRRFAGRRLESRNRFVRYEPPRLVEFELPHGWLTGHASYLVEPHPAGSLLVGTMRFEVHGPGQVLQPILRLVLSHDARRDDARLKSLLEAAAQSAHGPASTSATSPDRTLRSARSSRR